MGSKGSNTTTTNSQPPAYVGQAYQDIINRAQGVASTPYTPYQGNMVAGFSPDQLAAFNTVQNSQGIAQPYIDQASGFAAQGAAPVANLSAADINKYYNPYQSMVIDATKANINETNAQQQQQLIGNAALQGAWGGDRVGVAQAELARQQNLSNNQTLGNLSAQGFSQAATLGNQQLLNQQQNAGRAGQAAYTFGSLGNEAQNTTLQGANAQLGTGGLQQQLSQANLNWPYQQYMQQQAFPYQQTGWLASIAGGIGSNAGGTSTTMPPAPNPWNSIIGLGGAAVGAYGGSGGFSGQNASNWNSSLPTGSFDGSGAFAEGGAVDSEFDNLSLPNIPDAGSSFIPSVNIPHGSGPPKPQAQPSGGGQGGGSGDISAGDVASTAMKFLPLFLGDGGRVVAGYADGGMPQMPFGGQPGFIPQAQAMRGAGPPRPPAMPAGNDNLGNMLQSAASAAGHLRGAVKPDQPQGFAEGGMPDDGSLNPRNWMGFETNDPQTGASVGDTFPPMQASPPAPSIVPDEMPPEITQGASASTFGGGEADPTDNGSALSFAEPAPGLGSPQATDLNPNGGVAQTQERQPQAPNPWWGLVQAGLATAASKSPFLGQAIGEGGLAGMKEYEGQQKHELEDRKVISDETYKKAHAKYLADQAFKMQRQLDIAQQQANTTEKYRTDQIDQRREAAALAEQSRKDNLYKTMVPATRKGDDGEPVAGFLQYNPETHSYDFHDNAVPTPKGAAAKAAPTSSTERLIQQVKEDYRKANPGKPELSTADANKLLKNKNEARSKFQDEGDKADIKRMNTYLEQGTKAESSLATLDQIDGLRKDAIKGPLIGPLAAQIHPATQALAARTNALALDVAQIMKGSLSDKDVAFVQSQVPSVKTVGPAGEAVSQMLRAGFERVKQRGLFFRQWGEAHGTLKGADVAWQKYANENPLTVADAKAIGGARFNPNYNRDFTKYLDTKAEAAPAGTPAAAAPEKGERRQFKQDGRPVWGVFDGSEWKPE